MNIPINYNNPYAYRFNNNISSLNDNLELIVPLGYNSFYKVRDTIFSESTGLLSGINQSVARKYK